MTTQSLMATINVLFVCTHNSARSILAEALLNHLGKDLSNRRFKAYSAGSAPRAGGSPHPLGLQVLRKAGITTEALRSKSWDEFAQPGAPKMDLIITVCDNAAGEACPYWPGNPASAHWGYPDPSAGQVSDSQKLQAFEQTLRMMRQRIQRLVSLPEEKLQGANLLISAKELAQE
jgi:arsenate reductase (thioredoxin)